MKANSNRVEFDYALHDAITGQQGPMAQRKRWWMRRLNGPDGARYARMLFGLPQGDA